MKGRAAGVTALVGLVLLAIAWAVFQLGVAHEPLATPSKVDPLSSEGRSEVHAPDPHDERENAEEPARASVASSSIGAAGDGPSSDSASIHARIVDENGAPLPGATMSFERRNETFETASGSDGKATLAFPTEENRSVWVYVLFAADGRTQESRRVKIELAGATVLGDVALRPAGSVKGVVVAAHGELFGARVRLCEPLSEVSDRERERIETLGAGLKGRSSYVDVEADGSFLIESVPVGPAIVVAFDLRSQHTLSAPFRVEVEGTVDVGELVLAGVKAERCIDGVVLDVQGIPSPSQSVELWQPGIARNVDPAVKYGFSDAEGRFRFVVPSGSTYHVVLMDKYHGEEIARVDDVSPGGEPVVLNIPPERFLDVHVKTTSGEPIEEAWISVADAEQFGLRVRPERTARGVWRFQAPARPFQFWVTAKGYEYWSSGILQPEALPERIDCALEPESGTKLHGIVTLEGKPLPGVRVIGYGLLDGPHRLNTQFTTQLVYGSSLGSEATGEDGAFEMLVKEDAELVFVVMESNSQRMIWRHPPITVRASGADLRLNIAIPALGSIEGNLLLAEGRDTLGQIVGASNGDGSVRSENLGADGAFRFEGLPPGLWQVRLITDVARHLGDRRAYSQDEEPTWDVDLAPGETAHFDIDLRHEVLCRLQGTVKLAPDGPTDWGYSLNGQYGSVEEDGQFEAEVFGPGSSWVALWGTYTPSISIRVFENIELPAGDSKWSFDLPSGELELNGIPAFDPNAAEEIETELLRLRSKEPDGRSITIRITTHSGGPLLLRGIPVGTWMIEARWAPDGSPDATWRTPVADVALTAGERKSIDLR